MIVRVSAGDTIGNYRLHEQLGQGGMAVVFLAYQPGLDREVAIKLLADPGRGPEFIERFRREARAISRLRHPNILHVFDFGEQGDLVYMVGDFIPGGTLASRLGKPLPLDWVAVRLLALASALDFAHAHGVIHRDVKPSNVLLTEDDLPVLSDFGVAKLLLEQTEALTLSGTVMGTPEYMSPEQALGLEVGPPCDVYSLGVVLYEMVTGRPPFSAPTPMAVALAHVNNPPTPPSGLVKGLPGPVSEVILRSLHKDPAQRYQSAGQLALDFVAAMGGDLYALAGRAAVTPSGMASLGGVTLLAASPATPSRPMTFPVAPRPEAQTDPIRAVPSRRGRRPLLVLGALLLVTVSAGAFFLTRQSTAPAEVRPAEAEIATIVAPATIPPTITPLIVLVSTAPPSSVPTATLRLAPAPSVPSARIVAPLTGARVEESPEIRGVREGPADADTHLWLIARSAEETRKWWVHKLELLPDERREWTAVIFLGGPSGSVHRVGVVVANRGGHDAIVQHLRTAPDQPFEDGLPLGVRLTDEILLQKRGP